MVRPHEEKVIRREKEKQREITAKFSTSWSWCKSLIFDPNAYNSIPFTAEVGLELPLPYVVMLPGLHLSMSSPRQLGQRCRGCWREELGDPGGGWPRHKGHRFLYSDPEKNWDGHYHFP